MDIDKLVTVERLKEIYGNDPDVISYQQKRLSEAVKGYGEHFGESEDRHIFSAAGRS